ncbi:MAG: glucosidase, partial [Chloroflexota bacterium]
SYMKMLYKYPQVAFPYAELVEENGRRGQEDLEYELLDTGVFAEDRYFDVLVEYAKAGQDDILVRISITNRGPEAATCHLLPTLWFRNTWSWGYPEGPMDDVPDTPELRIAEGPAGSATVEADHPAAGMYYLYAAEAPELLFTGNETNMERLFDSVNLDPYVKDAFHRHVVNGESSAVNPDQVGTKAAAWYCDSPPAGETEVYQLRLSNGRLEGPFDDFDAIFHQRQEEADEFYAAIQHPDLDDEAKLIQRQAFAGLMWTKQLYYYDVPQWLRGDPGQPKPPASRWHGRNSDWTHLNNFDVISMPDKWEYPWYAAWDLAFHTLSIALIDPDFAKRQLILMTREWFMHPNGQLPAYEWAFGDVNPPVHAWAAWRVYLIEAQQTGEPDRQFLEGIFHKLLLNFTWWVNRKDADGNNIFQGGFLGLDNIGVFDRNADLPLEGHIDQADGTAWMGFYCLMMLEIALELAKENPVYQDTATKYFEHFLRVANAMTEYGRQGGGLWDEADGFFYDAWHTSEDEIIPMKVRSLVGLLPLFAVAVLEPECLDEMEDFARRLHWFVENRPHLSGNMASVDEPGVGRRRLLAILTRKRLIRVLQRMLDEDEFLSPYGIRSLSKYHQEHPYIFELDGKSYTVNYEPAESRTWLFGGNSNWRGPIWFPTNYLIVESLRTFHRYYGDDLKVEYPTGSGREMTLAEVAEALSQRLQALFQLNDQGLRPAFGSQTLFQQDPHWRDLILFYEYFHADNGAGLGASHQTGWTALVANLIHESVDG